MNKFSIVFSVVIGLLLSACSAERELVKDGNSIYEIVLSDVADVKQYQPALELQRYLAQISGAELPIVNEKDQNDALHKIYLRVSSKQKKAQLSIKTEGKNLILSGGSNEALKHAIFEFLEHHLGCRWYSPTVEKVPIQRTIILPDEIDYSYTPDILTRTVHSKLFYENHAFADKLKVSYEAFPYYVPEARVHTFHRFMPEEKFYKDHPEYFALRGTRRLPTQLCLTNDRVLDLVKDSVASYFKQYPEASVISVSQDDNQQYCKCENCSAIDEKEGSHAGSLIHFVNKVARAFPDKTISTLAYQYTRKPPQISPEKNVLVTLCSIECDRSGPIEDKCKDFAQDLIGWKKISDNIRIWDYTTQFTNFLAPFPNIETLQPNIQFFRDNKAKWVFEQHSNNPSELFELRSYVMAKLLWNPDSNLENLVVDFTDGYYQEGGVYVKKYVDRIHEELSKDPDFFLFLYGDPSQAFDSYLRPELLSEFDNYFNQAEKAVLDSVELLQRIRTARLSIDYAILEASRKNLTKAYSLVQENSDGTNVANAAILKRLSRFEKTCADAGIKMMNEMGFAVDEYVRNYQAAIQIAVIPNKALGKKVVLGTQPKKYANEDPQVLTDGALGGNGFYANWLGFEGTNMEAVIDMGKEQELNQISLAFLQVTNHVVFFPEQVTYSASQNGVDFVKLGTVINDEPLNKESKVNDIKYFNLKWNTMSARYIRIEARNMNKAPYWHHAAGLPTWIFADEIIIE
ncbi:MAG: DUF4838 domain-containing protein [Reichenbachiella sp.]|uniref:DUF4838 domain-containing protein n=1 Tax=Reichenbachiella sp. TaxID=2184521 RepID=UPI00326350A9